MTSDDPEFWFSVGVDIAPRIWLNADVLKILSAVDIRELGREQIQNPVPGANRAICELELQHPQLRR